MAPKHRTTKSLLHSTLASKLRQARDLKHAKVYRKPLALRVHDGLCLAIREKRHHKWLEYFRLAHASMIQVGAQFGAYQWIGHQVIRWGLVEAAVWWMGRKNKEELKNTGSESDRVLEASKDEKREEE